MKRSLFTISIIVLLLTIWAPAWAFQTTREDVPSTSTQGEFKTTSELIPGATPGQVDKIVKRETGRIEQKLFGTKKKPGGAIGELSNKTESVNGKLDNFIAPNGPIDKINAGVNGANDKLDKLVDPETGLTATVSKDVAEKIDGLTGEKGAITELNKKVEGIKSNAILMTILIFGGIALVFLLILTLLWPMAYRHQRTLSRVESRVKDIPKETAALVKKLEPVIVPFSFIVSKGKLNGKKVEGEYDSDVDGGSHKSLHVPKDVPEVSDPSEIEQAPITGDGPLRRSTGKIMKVFFEGGFNGDDSHSKNQKALIWHLKGIKKIRFTVSEAPSTI